MHYWPVERYDHIGDTLGKHVSGIHEVRIYRHT